MSRVPFALLLALLPLCAQPRRPASAKPTTRPSARPMERLVSIEVKGSKLYSSDDLAPLTELKPNTPFVRADLDAARARLLDTKLFGEVSYEYRTRVNGNQTAVDVTYEVQDFPEKYPLRFERLGKPEAELRSLLKSEVPLYREPLPYSPWLLEQVRLTLMRQVGPVASRITGDNGKDQFVLIYPKGAPPVVAEVRFKGSQVLSNEELVFAMRGTAVGIEYREGLFRELLQLGLVPLYEARGRIRVSFPQIEAEESKTVPGIIVTTTVVEGPSYDISGVKIEGIEGERLNRELSRVAMLAEGDLANMEEVRAAEKRMLTIVKRQGFLDATAEATRAIDDEQHKVAVTFRFTPGEQYTFGRLTLKGLDILSEPALKKMWGLDPGKPFNPEYPDVFLSRIKEQRLLDNLREAKATVTPDPATHTVDVTLEFK